MSKLTEFMLFFLLSISYFLREKIQIPLRMEGGWGKFVRLLQERGQTLDNYRSINKEQFNALLDNLGINDPSERAGILHCTFNL